VRYRTLSSTARSTLSSTMSSSSSSSSPSSSSSSSAPRVWLLKGEPDSHKLQGKEVGLWPFARIAALPSRTAPYFGVRNPQARTFLRDGLKVGDRVAYYHASCKQPGVYGVCRVARAGYPDEDALDRSSPFFDEKSSAAAPRWFRVDLEALDSAAEGLLRPVLLSELRADAASLGDMVLLRQPRLSVQPVTAAQWARVLELSRRGAAEGALAAAPAAAPAATAAAKQPGTKKRAAPKRAAEADAGAGAGAEGPKTEGAAAGAEAAPKRGRKKA
jgi:predicted RNA-binding protein with PUA-like domain